MSMRHLRTYESKAQRDHFCSHCMDYIRPGDKYSADVFATDKGILVTKYHSTPGCEFPPDPDDFVKTNSETENIETLLRDAA